MVGIPPAAIVFPEGIHSSSPGGFLALVFLFNFVLAAGGTYAILTGLGFGTAAKARHPR